MLKNILKFLTRRVLRQYHPVVIGVTGSVGKTTTKEAIYAVLKDKYFVRKSEGNINTDLGIPLTVLGLKPAGTRDKPATLRSRFILALGIAKSIFTVFGLSTKKYPDFLVLELGADRPGDMDYLTDLVKPHIAIVSAVGDTPVHVEFYESPVAVAREKAKIFSHIGKEGLAVLNYDDPVVMGMKSKIKGHVMTIGFSHMADLWASDVAYYVGDGGMIAGLSIKIHKGESFLPVRLPGFVSAHQLYAVLAAASVGIFVGMNLVDIIHALEGITLSPHRLTLLNGKNKSVVIDDTYNASPLSMQAALETLKEYPGKRKIAILGDMLELGKHAKAEHKKIGELAAKNADVVILVGKLWPKADYQTSAEAKDRAKTLVQEGDVILVKGSRATQMELVVDVLCEKT